MKLATPSLAAASPLAPGLAALGSVALNPAHQRLHAACLLANSGPAPWRQRKSIELRELLVLAQIAPRLQIVWADLREAMRVLLRLRVTMPRLLPGTSVLEIAHGAELGLTLRPESLFQPQPGWAFLQILSPDHVWHPNVSAREPHVLCLGTKLPIGIPAAEVLLMAYGALTMQSVQIDLGDPAGVMNAEAARWFQVNTHRLPLTREPFVETTLPTPGS
jgi:hypothetical protein